MYDKTLQTGMETVTLFRDVAALRGFRWTWKNNAIHSALYLRNIKIPKGKRSQVHNQNGRVESLCDRLYASLACVTARIGGWCDDNGFDIYYTYYYYREKWVWNRENAFVKKKKIIISDGNHHKRVCEFRRGKKKHAHTLMPHGIEKFLIL